MTNPTNPNVLQIDDLTMQPLKLSDLDALVAIWADAEVTRFLPSRGLPISRANVEKSLESFIHHWEMQKYGRCTRRETSASGDPYLHLYIH